MSVAISNVPGLSFGLPELIVITVGVTFMACLCLSDGTILLFGTGFWGKGKNLLKEGGHYLG